MFNDTLLGMMKLEESGTVTESVNMDSYPVLECSDDPIDACLRVAYESEQNWSNLWNAIALDELAVFEATGAEPVYEAASLKTIGASLVSIVEKAWSKVQGIFKAMLARIQSYVVADKSFLKANEEKLKKLGTFKSDVEVFDFKDGKDLYGKVKSLNDVKLVRDLSPDSLRDTNLDAIREAVKNYNEGRKEFWNKSREQVCGAASDNISDFAKCVAKLLRNGGEKVKVGSVNASVICDEIKSGKGAQVATKRSFEEAKKIFAQNIKEAKALDKKITNIENKIDRKSTGVMVAAAKAYSDIMRGSITMLNVILSEDLKAIAQQNRQAKYIAVLALKSVSKEKPEVKAVGESFLDRVEII